jgi:hypothetical protein
MTMMLLLFFACRMTYVAGDVKDDDETARRRARREKNVFSFWTWSVVSFVSPARRGGRRAFIIVRLSERTPRWARAHPTRAVFP